MRDLRIGEDTTHIRVWYLISWIIVELKANVNNYVEPFSHKVQLNINSKNNKNWDNNFKISIQNTERISRNKIKIYKKHNKK
jgi:hypothetical protein